MGSIKTEDIMAVRVKHEIVCMSCLTSEESDAFKESDVITENDIEKEETTYWCDRCEERIG